MRLLAPLAASLVLAACVQPSAVPPRVVAFDADNRGWCGPCNDKLTVTWDVEPHTPVLPGVEVQVEFDGKVVHTITGQMTGTDVPIPQFCGSTAGEGKTGRISLVVPGIQSPEPLPLQQSLDGELKLLNFEPVCTDGSSTTWEDETGFIEALYPSEVRVRRLRNKTYYDKDKDNEVDPPPTDIPISIDITHPPSIPTPLTLTGQWTQVEAATTPLYGDWTAVPTPGGTAPGQRCPPSNTDPLAAITLLAEAEIACATP